jgi:hypothetical protein
MRTLLTGRAIVDGLGGSGLSLFCWDEPIELELTTEEPRGYARRSTGEDARAYIGLLIGLCETCVFPDCF